MRVLLPRVQRVPRVQQATAAMCACVRAWPWAACVIDTMIVLSAIRIPSFTVNQDECNVHQATRASACLAVNKITIVPVLNLAPAYGTAVCSNLV
jgi:hypothetical protein